MDRKVASGEGGAGWSRKCVRAEWANLRVTPNQGEGKRGRPGQCSGTQKAPEPLGAGEGAEGRRDTLALHGGKSWICHIPWRPWLPSCWAWKSPWGRGWGGGWSRGWKNWSSFTTPPPPAWSSRRGCGQELEVPHIPQGIGMGGEEGRREGRGST